MDILLARNGKSPREQIMKETKPKKIILSEEAVRLSSINSVLEMMKAIAKEKKRLKK